MSDDRLKRSANDEFSEGKPDWLLALRRLLDTAAAANGGGVIATLAFIGTFLGLREEPVMPIMVYYVLLVFVGGLAATFAARALDAAMTIAIHFYVSSGRDYRTEKAIRSLLILFAAAIGFSIGTLVAGTLVGLVQLYEITEWVRIIG